MQAIFDEIVDTAGQAIEKALSDLPDGFPGALADSITSGIHTRLRLFAHHSDT
jgi:hypothetical protein